MRRYINEKHTIGYEDGESYIRFIAEEGKVFIYACNMTGDVALAPKQFAKVAVVMAKATRDKRGIELVKATKGKARRG